MKTLLSMVDFVEEIKDYVHESHNYDRAIELIFEYSTFLKKPLNLGMFVPCDENGNVINEVPYYADGIDKVEEYKKAKEKVLFKGFEFYGIVKNTASFSTWKFKHNGQTQGIVYAFKTNQRTIESLVSEFNPEFELTESAIKQILG